MTGSPTRPPYLEEDRPTLWPHSAPERTLPAGIENLLLEAAERVTDDVRRALACLDEAAGLARQREDPRTLARTLYRAAGIARQAGHPDRCYALCMEAQPLLEQGDDRWRATKMMLLRGECYVEIGEPERALEITQQAAERFRLIDDRTQLARSVAQLARAHARGGDIAAAVVQVERALAMSARCGDSALEITLRHLEASLRLEQARRLLAAGDRAGAFGERARASAVLPDVRALASPFQQPDGAAVLETCAQAALAVGDLETFVRAIRRLGRWSGGASARLERGACWLLLAQAHDTDERPGAAVACARRAVAQLGAWPAHPKFVAAHLLLAATLERAGDLGAAYGAQVFALRAEDELQREAITRRASVLALDLSADRHLREAERTLAYAQRLSNVGHLVASVNHELNQPMASIRMAVETSLALIERGERDEALDGLREIRKLGARLTDLTAQLSAFPVRPGTRVAGTSLRQAIADSITLLRSRLAQTPCEIALEFDDAWVQAHEGRLVRVIANLINNALDVLEPVAARRIVFGVERDGPCVVLAVRDNGPGLAPAVVARLFEPFFSTKPAGRGLGLGLAMARDVLREMGGDIVGDNADAGGAVFRIVLPAAAAIEAGGRA